MKELKMIFVIIIFAITLFGIIMLSTNNIKTPKIDMPWQSYATNGITKVFGLTLGKSTLKDAMMLFGKELEISVFKDKKNNTKSLEVYFDGTKLGGISAKIILTLNAKQSHYELLNANIKNYKTMPSGNEKIEFQNYIYPKLINLTIKDISFIPSINLSEKEIINTFGAPHSKQNNIWIYPKKGLKILIDEKLKILEYTND